jgi:hypothetical protein
MLPIQVFIGAPEGGYKYIKDIVAIIYRENYVNTIYVLTNGLLIDYHFHSNRKSIICYDLLNGKRAAYISFDRKLNIQEIAEELSKKLEYNTDRIRTAIADADTPTIELALVPRSKRAA